TEAAAVGTVAAEHHPAKLARIPLAVGSVDFLIDKKRLGKGWDEILTNADRAEQDTFAVLNDCSSRIHSFLIKKRLPANNYVSILPKTTKSGGIQEHGMVRRESIFCSRRIAIQTIGWMDEKMRPSTRHGPVGGESGLRIERRESKYHPTPPMSEDRFRAVFGQQCLRKVSSSALVGTVVRKQKRIIQPNDMKKHQTLPSPS
ncbi:unnamed protein product, partial [Vitrella brassicaformis CCMP3155]